VRVSQFPCKSKCCGFESVTARCFLAALIYTASITTRVKDLAGNPLPKPKTWRFTTLSALPLPTEFPDAILVPGETRTTVADALKVLRIAINIDQATQNDLNNGDVAPLGSDGRPQPDGVVNIQDAVVILRKPVGLVTW
jgi:Big-like domain-containing protein